MDKDQKAMEARTPGSGNGASGSVGRQDAEALASGIGGPILPPPAPAQESRAEALPRPGQQTDGLSGLVKKSSRLNWIIRLGRWWEGRRVVRQDELLTFLQAVDSRLASYERGKLPFEMAQLKVRVDRLELYVGLKRDPKPVVVPGEARIS